MHIKVAAFGSKEAVSQLQEYEKDSDLTIIPYAYTNPTECIDLIEKAYTCDVYLFTGPVPYLYVHPLLEKSTIPAVHVPFDQLMIANAFYLLAVKQRQPIDRISIDVMHEHYVTEIIRDLHLTGENIYIYDFGEDQRFEISTIIRYHKERWEDEEIDIVLTSIHAVHQALSDEGIPCMKMPIPKSSFTHALEEAKTLGELKLRETAQIIVGFVKIRHMEQLLESQGDFHGEKTLLSLHQLLLTFTHEKGFTLYKGNNRFVLFGTKGSFEKLIQDDKLYAEIKEIENTLHISIIMGFGSGYTAQEAENNAKKALTHLVKQHDVTGMLYHDSGSFIQLFSDNFEAKKTTLMNRFINQAAFTRQNASTFVDFLYLRDYQPFTAWDYAAYAGVTTRTATRQINKLLQYDVLEIMGEEKLYDKGRPRKVYQLKENIN